MSNQRSSVVRFLSLFCLATGLGLATTWSGTLVDARCFTSAEQNHNVSESTSAQDLNWDVRMCSPKAKTHSFAIVLDSGVSIPLDAAGNAKAAELVKGVTGKSRIEVSVNGTMNQKTIAVGSITPAN